MIEFDTILRSPNSLNANKAVRIINVCRTGSAEVSISNGISEVATKSVMSILSVGAGSDGLLHFKVLGPDENDIANGIKKIMENK